MCEMSKSQRRTFRDQDPPRICLVKRDYTEFSRSTPNSPTASNYNTNCSVSSKSPVAHCALEKCFSEPEFFQKPGSNLLKNADNSGIRCSSNDEENNCFAESQGRGETGNDNIDSEKLRLQDLSHVKVPTAKVLPIGHKVNANGATADKSNQRDLEEVERLEKGGEEDNKGKKEGRGDEGEERTAMAPGLGAPPPPPPPAPTGNTHVGPDGFILPRKPYNPCLNSSSHKDLRRELLFNNKIGKNVLNQKSELQRALERHREMASKKEEERNREESYKNDPRTALQRAIEQRAKHMKLMEQAPQSVEPQNLLVTARAKLRPRRDSE